MCLRELVLDGGRALGVVLIVTGVAFLLNFVRSNPLSWQREPEDLVLARQIDSAASNVTPEIAHVTLDEAVELLAEEKAVFADARDEEFFKLGHITERGLCPEMLSRNSTRNSAKRGEGRSACDLLLFGGLQGRGDCGAGSGSAGVPKRKGLRRGLGGMAGRWSAARAMKAVLFILRLLLAGAFLMAGVIKVFNPAEFAVGVGAFQVFPERSINPIAIIVPILEIVVALLLIKGRTSRLGAFLALALSLTFLSLFAFMMAQGREVECSCFGGLKVFGTGTKEGVVRAALLFLVSFLLYVKALSPVFAGRPSVKEKNAEKSAARS